MEKLVFAELSGSVTFQMLEDKMVLIIADNGLFMVTTKENALNYNENFFPVDTEARKTYKIDVREGRVVSDMPKPTPL